MHLSLLINWIQTAIEINNVDTSFILYNGQIVACDDTINILCLVGY